MIISTIADSEGDDYDNDMNDYYNGSDDEVDDVIVKSKADDDPEV